MSEFHRMITYLYLYEQGVKNRNIGFAKVEKREQRCFLEIHMKNTGYSLCPVPVYFYVQQQEKLVGIPLGNFSLTRGNGEFKTVLDAERLKDSPYTLDAVKGVYIPLTERTMLVSQWDDDEFHREQFVDLSDFTAPSNQTAEKTETSKEPPVTPMRQIKAASIPAVSSIKNQLSASAGPQDSESQIQNTTSPTQESTPPQQNTPSEETLPTQEPDLLQEPQSIESTEPILDEMEPAPQNEHVPSTTEPTETESKETESKETESKEPAKEPPKAIDALKALEALPRQEYRTGGFRSVSKTSASSNARNHGKNKTQTERTYAEPPEDWSLRWRFILENYPVMTPFSGDENTLCVRLELKDLRQLPRQFWYLGNNSFLLHGFFNYRYLILGMTKEYGVKKWFIGIPGVFQNPERVMAALFGFPEFRRENPSPINTGEFGYWYRYLNELSQPSDNESS